jgi:hypothetical protein
MFLFQNVIGIYIKILAIKIFLFLPSKHLQVSTGFPVDRFQNGVCAPHMLGNQLNPSSTMAQKMSDTLSAEMEAHSIFNDSSNSTTSLIGPQLHSRVIASVSTMMNKGQIIGSCLDSLCG